MLFPRFTIRTALAMVTGCAVLFLILGMAYRGQDWAWGVVIGVVSLLVTGLVHGAWFGIVWLFSQLLSGREGQAPGAMAPASFAVGSLGAASVENGESISRHLNEGDAPR